MRSASRGSRSLAWKASSTRMRIGRGKPVLFPERPMRPDGHVVAAAKIAEFGEEPIT